MSTEDVLFDALAHLAGCEDSEIAEKHLKNLETHLPKAKGEQVAQMVKQCDALDTLVNVMRTFQDGSTNLCVQAAKLLLLMIPKYERTIVWLVDLGLPDLIWLLILNHRDMDDLIINCVLLLNEIVKRGNREPPPDDGVGCLAGLIQARIEDPNFVVPVCEYFYLISLDNELNQLQMALSGVPEALYGVLKYARHLEVFAVACKGISVFTEETCLTKLGSECVSFLMAAIFAEDGLEIDMLSGCCVALKAFAKAVKFRGELDKHDFVPPLLQTITPYSNEPTYVIAVLDMLCAYTHKNPLVSKIITSDKELISVIIKTMEDTTQNGVFTVCARLLKHIEAEAGKSISKLVSNTAGVVSDMDKLTKELEKAHIQIDQLTIENDDNVKARKRAEAQAQHANTRIEAQASQLEEVSENLTVARKTLAAGDSGSKFAEYENQIAALKERLRNGGSGSPPDEDDAPSVDWASLSLEDLMHKIQESASSQKAVPSGGVELLLQNMEGHKERLKKLQEDLDEAAETHKKALEKKETIITELNGQMQEEVSKLEASQAELGAQVEQLTEELQEAREEMDEKDKALKELKDKCEALEGELEETGQEGGEQQNLLQDMRQQLKDLVASAAELQKAKAELEQELETTKTELQTTKMESEATKKQLEEELATVKAELESVNTDRETTKSGLESTDHELMTTKLDLETTKDELEALRADSQTVYTDLETTKSELESLRNDHSTAIADLESAKAELQRLQTTLEGQADMDSVVKNYEAQLEEGRTKMKDLEKEHETERAKLKEDHETEHTKLKEEHEKTLETESSKQSEAEKEYQSKLSEAEEKHQALSKKHEDLEAQHAALVAKNEEVGAQATDQKAKADQELAELQAKVDSLETEASAKVIEKQELETKLADVEGKLAVAEKSLEGTSDDLKKQIQALQKELEAKSVEVSDAMDLVNSSDQELLNVKQEKDKLTEQILNLNEQMEKNQSETSLLAKEEEEQRKKLESDIEALKTSLEAKEKTLEELNTKNKELEDAKAKLEVALKEKDDVGGDLAKAHDAAKDELQRTSTERDELKGQVQELTSSIAVLQASITDLEEGKSKAKQSLEEAEKKISGLDEDINAKASRIVELEKDKSSLEDSLQAQKEAMASSGDTASKLQTEIDDLKAKISAFEAETQELKSSLETTQKLHAELTGQHSTLKSEHTDLTGAHQNLQKVHDQLKEAHQQDKDTLIKLKVSAEGFDQVKAELEKGWAKERGELEQSINQYKQKMSKLEADLSDAKEELMVVQEHVVTIDEELLLLRDRNQQLQGEMSAKSMRSLHATGDLQAERDKLASQLRDLNSFVVHANSSVIKMSKLANEEFEFREIAIRVGIREEASIQALRLRDFHRCELVMIQSRQAEQELRTKCEEMSKRAMVEAQRGEGLRTEREDMQKMYADAVTLHQKELSRLKHSASEVASWEPQHSNFMQQLSATLGIDGPPLTPNGSSQKSSKQTEAENAELQELSRSLKEQNRSLQAQVAELKEMHAQQQMLVNESMNISAIETEELAKSEREVKHLRAENEDLKAMLDSSGSMEGRNGESVRRSNASLLEISAHYTSPDYPTIQWRWRSLKYVDMAHEAWFRVFLSEDKGKSYTLLTETTSMSLELPNLQKDHVCVVSVWPMMNRSALTSKQEVVSFKTRKHGDSSPSSECPILSASAVDEDSMSIRRRNSAAAPGNPTTVNIDGPITSNSCAITWNRTSDDDTLQYRVWLCQGDGHSFQPIETVSGTHTTIKNLSCNSMFEAYVTTVLPDGFSVHDKIPKIVKFMTKAALAEGQLPPPKTHGKRQKSANKTEKSTKKPHMSRPAVQTGDPVNPEGYPSAQSGSPNASVRSLHRNLLGDSLSDFQQVVVDPQNPGVFETYSRSKSKKNSLKDAINISTAIQRASPLRSPTGRNSGPNTGHLSQPSFLMDQSSPRSRQGSINPQTVETFSTTKSAMALMDELF